MESIHHRKVPFFKDCKWVYCEHFGRKMSSPSCPVLEIGFCPNMDMGVASFGFFADF